MRCKLAFNKILKKVFFRYLNSFLQCPTLQWSNQCHHIQPRGYEFIQHAGKDQEFVPEAWNFLSNETIGPFTTVAYYARRKCVTRCGENSIAPSSYPEISTQRLRFPAQRERVSPRLEFRWKPVHLLYHPILKRWISENFIDRQFRFPIFSPREQFMQLIPYSFSKITA